MRGAAAVALIYIVRMAPDIARFVATSAALSAALKDKDDLTRDAAWLARTLAGNAVGSLSELDEEVVVAGLFSKSYVSNRCALLFVKAAMAAAQSAEAKRRIADAAIGRGVLQLVASEDAFVAAMAEEIVIAFQQLRADG